VFCPLIADPKPTRSFVVYQRGNEKDLATDIGAVGTADQFPFFRAAAGSAGNGVQLGVAGAVFAQFDLGSASYDLLNADYLIGIPLTVRASGFVARRKSTMWRRFSVSSTGARGTPRPRPRSAR
jgi:hypothetical protein